MCASPSVVLAAAFAVLGFSNTVLASCPTGIVTDATFNMVAGDSCPDGLEDGAGGIINFSSASTITIANTSAANGLVADGAMTTGMDITVNGNGGYAANAEDDNDADDSTQGSFIDATHGTALTLGAGNGAAARMLSGGLVKFDGTTEMTITGNYGTGACSENTWTGTLHYLHSEITNSCDYVFLFTVFILSELAPPKKPGWFTSL
jgi:hypothetical protein